MGYLGSGRNAGCGQTIDCHSWIRTSSCPDQFSYQIEAAVLVSSIAHWLPLYRNGATYHAQYVATPPSRTITQSTSSVRIHHFQCLNRSHSGRTLVPATMTI